MDSPSETYDTFGECVGQMQRRGFTDEAAVRVCLAMQEQGSGMFHQAAELATAIDALEEALAPTVAVGPGVKASKRLPVSRTHLRLARRLDRDAKVIAAVGAANLTPAFKRLGNLVAEAFLERVVTVGPAKGRKDGLDFWSASSMDDGAIQASLHSVETGVDWTGYGKAWLGRPYERLYQMAGEMTFAAVSEHVGINIGFNLSEPAAQRVLATGGTRRGLIDLRGDTRSAVLGTLEEARKEGWGPPDTARRLRELVPAGRFWRMQQADPPHGNWPGGGVNYRTNLIARTETKYAQNIAAYEAGAQAGFDTFVVFDARLGPTDAECEAINGQIVDGPTARRLLEEEHPNGTRSISPVPRDTTIQPIVDVPVSRAQAEAFAHRPPPPPELPPPSTVQQVIEQLPLEQQFAAAKRYDNQPLNRVELLTSKDRMAWLNDLPSIEKAGLNQFKGTAYDDINEYQVRKAKGTLDQWLPPGNPVADSKRRQLELNVDGLNRAIEKAPPLESDPITYRGMVLDRAKYDAILATGEIRQVSTFSTTLERQVAHDFAEPWGDKRGIRLNILVPRGTRAASFNPGDREYELAFRGPAKFKVIKVHPEEAVQHAGRSLTPIDVVLVPDAPLAAKGAPPLAKFDPVGPLPEHVKKPLATFETAHRTDKVETAFAVDVNGAVVLDKSQGNVKAVSFTADEVAKVRGTVMTHNHPSGRALSADDLTFLKAADLHEIRAARNGDGNVTARLTDKGKRMRLATWTAEIKRADDGIRRINERDLFHSADMTEHAAKLERFNRTHHDQVLDLLQQRGYIVVTREP